MTDNVNFDYQKQVWGGEQARLSHGSLGFLRLKYCLEALHTVKGRVLDVGCGAGGFAKAIKHYRRDLQVYGVDIGARAIRHANRDSNQTRFLLGDLYELPHRQEVFDAVVIEDVLEHLREPQKALSAIFGVLKSGGVFHAFIPLEGALYSLHHWMRKLGWRAKERLAGHIQQFNLSDVNSIYREAGFEIINRRYSGHFLGQLVDVGYFCLLEWTGTAPPEGGLEEKIKSKPLERSLKDLAVSATNVESRVLHWVPGFGLHLTAIK